MKTLISLLSTKVLFWIKPDLKHVAKTIIVGVITILLIIYVHSEFLKWSEFSGSTKYVSYSFILKNLLIIFAIFVVFLIIKKSNNKNDGFDKFRNRDLNVRKDKFSQDNISFDEIDDKYFDRFRTKKRLRTTREIKLEKKSK